MQLFRSSLVVICFLTLSSCIKSTPAQVPPVVSPNNTPPTVEAPTPVPGTIPDVTTPPPEPWEANPPSFAPGPSRPPWSRVAVYSVADKTINAAVNQQYAIAAYWDPRTGDDWYEAHDENMTAVLDSTWVAYTPQVPIDGIKWFLFKALKPGKTEIALAYRNRTTGQIREQKVFSVNIIAETAITLDFQTPFGGLASYLTILGDGSIMYLQGQFLRFATPQNPGQWITNTGNITGAELSDLLELVNDCPFDAKGDMAAPTRSIDNDANCVFTVNYRGVTKTITGNFNPVVRWDYPDVPDPVRILYQRLSILVANNVT